MSTRLLHLAGTPLSPTALNSSEREELQELKTEMELSSLGDRPHSIGADKLKRLLELERRARYGEPPAPMKIAIVIPLDDLVQLQREYISTLAPRDRLETQLRFSMFLQWLRRREEATNDPSGR